MTKDQLKEIFVVPDRYEDGIRQLIGLLGGDPLHSDCYQLLSRFNRLVRDHRKGEITREAFSTEQSRLIGSALQLIEEIPEERLVESREVVLLILADGEAQEKKFVHYYQQRYPLPQVRVEVAAPTAFALPQVQLPATDTQPAREALADCLLFDGSALPRSKPKEQLTEAQRARLDLLLAYLDPARYLEVPQPPLIFFGPNRNELFASQYQDRYLGANSWITLYTRTQELVGFVRAERGEG